jgi:hypothetical protein
VARQTFGKLQRDRDKRAKAAAKREKRQNKDSTDEVDEDAPVLPVDNTPPEKLLEMIAALHERFDDGGISFEDFEEEKAALMARLSID